MRFLVSAISLCVLLMMGSPALAGPCASGDMTVTASFPNDLGFEGLYKYTITGSWETGAQQGLSHISFTYQLECPCVCDTSEVGSAFASFPIPAGTATGTDSLDNPCTVEFLGLSECNGDGTISSTDPAIKFEIPDDTVCNTGNTGTGTWCFYSVLPPLPSNTYIDATYIKFGNNECTLDLVGELPNCTACGPVPIENSTWGQIKKDF